MLISRGSSHGLWVQTERNEQAGHLTGLTGTPLRGPACRVVLKGWPVQSCHIEPIQPDTRPKRYGVNWINWIMNVMQKGGTLKGL